MIKEISLHGFKSYVNQNFDLRPLTILTGLNSSGKSKLLGFWITSLHIKIKTKLFIS